MWYWAFCRTTATDDGFYYMPGFAEPSLRARKAPSEGYSRAGASGVSQLAL